MKHLLNNNGNFNICDDIIYNIILQSDIYTIKNLSMLNKNTLKLCNDKHLWITIFNRDNLRIISDRLNNNFNLWIKEYIIVKNLIDIIIKIAKTENDNVITIKTTYNIFKNIMMSLSNEYLYWLETAELIMQEYNINTIVNITFNIDPFTYKAKLNIHSGQFIVVYNIYMESDEVKNFLLHIFNHYPSIDITDMYNVTYYPHKLLHDNILSINWKNKITKRLKLWNKFIKEIVY